MNFNIFLVILSLIFFTKLLENFLQWFISLFESDYIKIYENSEWIKQLPKLINSYIFLLKYSNS